MSRGSRKNYNRRDVSPDAKYGSVVVAKFINVIMEDGKKVVAEKILYNAMEKISSALTEKHSDIAMGLEAVILIVGPTIRTKTKRVGGVNYQVPVNVSYEDKIRMAMRMLLKAAIKARKTTISDALASELLLAAQGKGDACKERDAIIKMAEANRAFSHLQ